MIFEQPNKVYIVELLNPSKKDYLHFQPIRNSNNSHSTLNIFKFSVMLAVCKKEVEIKNKIKKYSVEVYARIKINTKQCCSVKIQVEDVSVLGEVPFLLRDLVKGNLTKLQSNYFRHICLFPFILNPK